MAEGRVTAYDTICNRNQLLFIVNLTLNIHLTASGQR
jgi:hypothetical protein